MPEAISSRANVTGLILSRLRKAIETSSFVRFLVSGGLNTLATYSTYLIMLQFVGYQVAFTLSYAFGIIVAYGLNRVFVFGSHRGWHSVLFFPFVYLIQYLASLAILWLWVKQLSMPVELAPLAAIAFTIPLTFVLSRLVFTRADAKKVEPRR